MSYSVLVMIVANNIPERRLRTQSIRCPLCRAGSRLEYRYLHTQIPDGW